MNIKDLWPNDAIIVRNKAEDLFFDNCMKNGLLNSNICKTRRTDNEPIKPNPLMDNFYEASDLMPKYGDKCLVWDDGEEERADWYFFWYEIDEWSVFYKMSFVECVDPFDDDIDDGVWPRDNMIPYIEEDEQSEQQEDDIITTTRQWKTVKAKVLEVIEEDVS